MNFDIETFFRTSILRIDDVNDVISEAPAKLSNSILLFVKGLGWLTSVNLPNVERRSGIPERFPGPML
jgi:hypothetical protein